MGQSLTTYHAGPAIITLRGQTFFSQDGFAIDWSLETFPVVVDSYQQVDERVRQIPMRLRFTPPGFWTTAKLNVLYYLNRLAFGDFVTPTRILYAIANNAINIPSHNLLSGDSVYFTNVGGALPSGLSAGTLYYIYAKSSDAVTVHTTYADATTGANPVAISGGTGTNRLVVNNTMTVQSQDGKLYTFYNAAITKMPAINIAATRTLFGQCEVSFFLKDGANLSDANSIYALSSNAWPGDGGLDPSQIITQAPALTWGVTAPWNSFNTKTGVVVNLAESLESIEIDGLGVIGQRYNGLVVTAQFQPVGPDQGDLPIALLVQGTGAAIGRSLSANGNNLDITVAGKLFVRLNNAALRGGPEQWAVRQDRIGQLTAIATRTFTNGLPNPLLVVDASPNVS